MGLIHLIGGEKGGVGKSFFSMSLLHFLSISSVPYVLVDADPNNPDVVAIYVGCVLIGRGYRNERNLRKQQINISSPI